jgi:CheY-like chemotaxis protein
MIKNTNLNINNNYNEILAAENNYISKSSNNLKEFHNEIINNETSISHRKEPINQLYLHQINNSINKGKNNNLSSFRNNDLYSGRDTSTIFRSNQRLDINYKDLNLKFDNRSVISSENNKSNESERIVKTFILDNTFDSNSFIHNIDLRILVVDDEDLIRRSHINIIKKYCKKEKVDMVIEEACDGADCLHKIYMGFLKGIKYDLILTDETMNFMNGGFTAKIIKSLIKKNILKDMKIIMITSYEINIIENSKSCVGIDHVFNKPLNTNILENIFSKCLDN